MRTTISTARVLLLSAVLSACGATTPTELEVTDSELKTCVGVGTRLVTTAATTMRSGPSGSSGAVRSVPANAVVETLASCPSRGWYNVRYDTTAGWIKGSALTTAPAACTPESNAAFCSRLGKTCGTATGTDNCGATRTVDCGTCPTTGGITTSALTLSSLSPKIGETLTGQVTLTNNGSASVTLEYVIIAARPPGGTNAGGPYLDLYQVNNLTLAPGQSQVVRGGRVLTSADPIGTWYSYVTYNENGAWHDSSQRVTFTVSAGSTGTTEVCGNGTCGSGETCSSCSQDCGTCTTTRTCTNPVFVTSDTNGGWSNGGYYVHNNMWNWQEGGPETLYACAYNNWYVDSTQPNTTSVKTYPNVHLDINNMNGAPLSNYRTITSTFAGVGPRVGIYNVAYDVWLNGVGWGGGTTEFMIWTENFNQRPLGSVQATVTFGPYTFDAWHYNDGNANVISLVSKTTLLSGTFDLKAMFDWAIGRGWLPANSTVNQIGYGVEICSTNNTKQRFVFTDFSVTMN